MHCTYCSKGQVRLVSSSAGSSASFLLSRVLHEAPAIEALGGGGRSIFSFSESNQDFGWLGGWGL